MLKSSLKGLSFYKSLAVSFILVAFVSIQNFAQPSAHFIPSKPITKDSLLSISLEKRFKSEKDTINFSKKKGKDFIIDQCSLRTEYVKSKLSQEYFLTGSSIDNYIQKIVQEIISKNSQLNYGIKVLISRDPEPNAFALGNGIVIFNIGMLNRVKTEADIAFILCHEFSHDYLRHGNIDLYHSAERLVDKELEAQLKIAMKEEFNTKAKVIALLLPGLKKSRQYNRGQELEADSLGLKFLANTKYSLQGGVSVMGVLDSLDIRMENDVIDLRKFFTMPQVAPGKYWFYYKGENSLGGGFAEEKDSLSDSLKTHPDCMLRKEIITSMIDSGDVGNLFLQDVDSFNAMKFDAEGEVIQLWLDWLYIDHTIYNSLLYLEKYPSNVFPRSVLSLSLAFISWKKKTMNAGYYLDLPSPKYDESFNRLLQFLREINPDENSQLSYWMIRPVIEELKKHEVYLAALVLSAYSMSKNDEYAQLRKEYTDNFPKGRYESFFPELEKKKRK